jgi:hypothetical protein
MTQLTFAAIRDQLEQSVGGARNLASFYTQRSMMDLNKRAARLLDEAANDCLAMLERVRVAVNAENLGDYAQWSDAELIARYVRLWSACQHAASRVASPMVTGPAKFPVHRNNKRIATEDRRYSDLSQFTKGIAGRIVKRANGARKASLGTDGLASAELQDLEARHAKRVQRQDLNTKAGKIIRRLKLTEEGEGPMTLCMELGKVEHKIPPNLATALLMPDYMGRRGYLTSTNNGAEIRRLAARIAEVKAKLARIEKAQEATEEAPARTVAGAQIVENLAEDRLQIIFEGKPSDAMRTVLKRGGYRWSPRNGAWQRQLTNNARYCLSHVTSQLEALQAI